MDVTPGKLAVAAAIATLLAWHGLRKKSLDKSGAIAGWVVGFLSFSSGTVFGVVLIVFFLAGSRVTKIGTKRKLAVEADHKEGGQRTWVQVLCNSATAVAMCLYHATVLDGKGSTLPLSASSGASALVCAYVAFYAACGGDTFASELGVLSSETPRLVTTLRQVPRGTNGGVTLGGTAASGLGGLVVGLGAVTAMWFERWMCETCTYESTPLPWRILGIGALMGMYGSMVDSLVGATLQYSGLDTERNMVVERPGPGVTRITGTAVLDNHAVNLVSATVTAATAWYMAPMLLA